MRGLSSRMAHEHKETTEQAQQIEKSLQSRRSGTYNSKKDDQEPGVFRIHLASLHSRGADSLDDSGTNI